MAVTKIHAIKSTLKKALDYIENPEKTDGELLVSGYNVDPLMASVEFKITETAANKFKGNYHNVGKGNNLAYHMIQSFSPEDKLTYKDAHEIGKKLANEFLEGKYEYVIATHIDKGHIHNHIIFNAVSFYDYKKLNTKPYKTAAKIRAISDRLCAEHNLSIIKEPKGLGTSYTEYKERKSNSSWKSEIRKRLKFILDRTTDYTQFKMECESLGISVDDRGKYIKFKMENQKKWTRGEKLSDTGKYMKDGIFNAISENITNQEYVKNAIKASAENSQTFNEFVKNLEKNGIFYIKNKAGTVTYQIDDVHNSKVKESSLGIAYSETAITDAINKKECFFIAKEIEPTIEELFNKTTKINVSDKTVELELKNENISKITVDGILLKVADNNGQIGKIFIDNSHINFDENSSKYKIFVTSKFEYYFTKERIDPDITEAEQLSNKFIKGETIIRNIELQNNIAPIEIEIPNENIKSMTSQGVTISLSELGIKSIFIENDFVNYDSNEIGKVTLSLYPNWNYIYFNEHQETSVSATIEGKALAFALNVNENIEGKPLYDRITYMQRKNKLADTKSLAETLNVMREKSICKMSDFDVKILESREKAQQVHSTMKCLDAKNQSYKKAAKYLITFNKYLPIQQELIEKSPFTRGKFATKYENELSAFKFAAAQLEKMGVNTSVDPDKVINLVNENSKNVTELNDKYQDILKEIRKLKEARNVVEELKQDEPHRDKAKSYNAKDEISI